LGWSPESTLLGWSPETTWWNLEATDNRRVMCGLSGLLLVVGRLLAYVPLLRLTVPLVGIGVGTRLAWLLWPRSTRRPLSSWRESSSTLHGDLFLSLWCRVPRARGIRGRRTIARALERVNNQMHLACRCAVVY
jgi:hypothetical protein